MTTSRRTFLAASAVGAVAPFVKASDKSGTKNPIIGQGDYQFECIHDWGDLPSRIKYGNTHSVCEDNQGHIYIHHTVHKDSQSPDSVVVFDEKGKFVRSWGAMFRGGAHGMYYHREGHNEYLYFADEKHGIVTKRTLKGEEVWTMGYPQDSEIYQKGLGAHGPGGSAGLNYRPTNISMAPNGDFWVGDGYGSYYMFHYTVDSPTAYPKLKNVFGGPAPITFHRPPRKPGERFVPPPPEPVGELNNPHGNMIDLRDPANPVHMIADRGNGRIVRYTLDDKPIDVIEGTRRPCYFHEHNGDVVVPDLTGPVYILDKGNKIVVTMGEGKGNPPRTTEDRSKFIPGQFVAPHGATYDHKGNIFIVEWVEIGRVTKLRRLA